MINTSFEQAPKLLETDLQSFDIVTHPPYGMMSSEHGFGRSTLGKLYDEFDKFLHLYRKSIQDVYVVVPERPLYNFPHLTAESQFVWEQAVTFDNHGTNMAMFKLTKKLKGEMMILDKSNLAIEKSPEISEVDAKLALVDNYNKPSSKKGWEKIVALRHQRRNEYLEMMKERDIKLQEESKQKIEEIRLKKARTQAARLEKAGISSDEIDLLQRRIDKTVEIKEKAKEKRNKKRSVPRW